MFERGEKRRGRRKIVIERLKSTSIWLIVALILSFCAVLFVPYGYETVCIDGTPQLLTLSVVVFVGFVGVAAWRRFRIGRLRRNRLPGTTTDSGLASRIAG